jgi:hypothetical protein
VGTNVEYEGTALPSVQAHVAVDSKSVALSYGKAAIADGARLAFNGPASLANWSLDDKAPLTVHATAVNVPASLIEKLTAYPMEGLLNGEVSMDGSMRQPTGSGHLTLTQARAWGEPLSAVEWVGRRLDDVRQCDDRKIVVQRRFGPSRDC